MSDSKSKSSKSFMPFTHEDIDLKNNLLNSAREMALKTDDVAAQLGCALIYSSFAEYLIGHLLRNLRHQMYRISYNDTAGVLFIRDLDESDGRTMSKIIAALEGYDFPDKTDIIKLSKQLNKSRNNLFHNLSKTSAESLSILDADTEIIKHNSEELVTKIGVVYTGLQKILIQTPVPDTMPQTNGSKVKPSKKKSEKEPKISKKKELKTD